MDLFEQLRFYLFSPDGLRQMIMAGGYLVLTAIVFAETGLMVGFFLPGDSLLFMAGVVSGAGHFGFGILNATLSLAAILGDTVGYWIGARAGRALFQREDTRWFKRKHLIRTQEFYEHHGGKTIVLARFVPIVRTFAPVVAGIAQMRYRRFLFFNVFGAIGWVLSMTTLGYFLGSVDWVQRNLEKVVVAIIFVSMLPWFFEFLKGGKRRAET